MKMTREHNATAEVVPTNDDNALKVLPAHDQGMDKAFALIQACNAHLRDDKIVKIRLGFIVTPEVEIEISNK